MPAQFQTNVNRTACRMWKQSRKPSCGLTFAERDKAANMLIHGSRFCQNLGNIDGLIEIIVQGQQQVYELSRSAKGFYSLTISKTGMSTNFHNTQKAKSLHPNNPTLQNSS